MTRNRQIYAHKLPTIAIVGRVNVGKSTFFNKLTEKSQAIVSKTPGTTRTSNEGIVNWRGREFKLIDTGGLTFTDDVLLEQQIVKQTEYAIKKADVIIFVTDAKTGILPQEYELSRKLLKKVKKPILLVANKVDSTKIQRKIDLQDYARLALGEPFFVSAASGRGLGDFLDLLFDELKKHKIKTKKISDELEAIQVAIIGKPNVGKSSIFNKIVGEEKVIVSDMAHTTREPHDTLIVIKGKTKKEDVLINFIDTAGIRRKSKVKGELEKEGIRKSIQAIEKADIVLFVLDINEKFSSQDKQLAGLIERRSKSVIVLANKWDLTQNNDQKTQSLLRQTIYANFPHLDFSPILLVSGLTGQSIHKIFPEIIKANTARYTEIPEKLLEKFLNDVSKRRLPTKGKGTRHPKLLGFKQIKANPPIFDLRIKVKTSLHRSYLNYLENRLREQFNFFATPIVIKLTKKG